MSILTRPSITRIARQAGVKSLSDDCYVTIHDLINIMVERIINASLVVNSERATKTLMAEDIYEGLKLCGYNVAQSNDLGTTTCT